MWLKMGDGCLSPLFRVFLRPYRLQVCAIVFFIFLLCLSNLYLPTLMSDIVDTGIIKGDVAYILRTGGFMLLVAILGTGCSVFASYLAAKVSTGFGRSLRGRVFAHVEQFAQHEFDKFGTSSLITRTTNDITQVQQVLMMMLRMMVMAPLTCIGGILMALSKNAQLSLIFVVTVPLLGLLIFVILKKGIRLFKSMQTKLDRLNRVLRESLTGIRVIRSFNRTEYESGRFREANRDLTDTAVKVNKIMAILMPMMMLVLNFSTIAILWFGAKQISDGDIQVGDLMAFLQYAMQILFAVMMVSMMFVMIPRASASALRIREVLDVEPGITSPTVETQVHMNRGHVEFRNVTFHYPGAEQAALSNVSFEVQPGEITAVIGGTGSGKSTLVQLIPRFYDVTGGAIIVDGVDVRHLDQRTLRTKIGLVPQKAVLFSGTVSENIRFGKEDATDEEIQHAAQIAQAAQFVSEMKDGFDSVLSQGGTNVSGGQKQRLSIARALVRKPEIFIFDDSFSALDFKTDADLRRALRSEVADKSVIIIAQRVSTVMDADKIIVLDNGRIAGIGNHVELMKTCEIYREIVRSQLSEEEIV